MALLFMDGFDHYPDGFLEKYDYNDSSQTSTTQARTGTRSMYGAGSVGKLVTSSSTTVIMGAGVYQNDGGWFAIVCLGGFGSSGYNQCTVQIQGDGSIAFKRGSTVGTIIAQTAAGVFRFGVWNYIEFKIVLSETVGSIVMKINGTTVLTSATNLDTCNLSTTSWSGIQFGGDHYTDDVYIADGSGSQNNDFLGECRVVTLLPVTDAVAAGSNAQFTPSTGTDHGALVDEAAPNDDTDYLSSSTLNHVDSWHYPALGYTGAIKGVQMSNHARKTDSGTRAIAAVTRPASTNRVHGTNHYLGTTYAYWMSLWELNPEDSAAWEVADVDGAEFGVKVTV